MAAGPGCPSHGSGSPCRWPGAWWSMRSAQGSGGLISWLHETQPLENFAVFIFADFSGTTLDHCSEEYLQSLLGSLV